MRPARRQPWASRFPQRPAIACGTSFAARAVPADHEDGPELAPPSPPALLPEPLEPAMSRMSNRGGAARRIARLEKDQAVDGRTWLRVMDRGAAQPSAVDEMLEDGRRPLAIHHPSGPEPAQDAPVLAVGLWAISRHRHALALAIDAAREAGTDPRAAALAVPRVGDHGRPSPLADMPPVAPVPASVAPPKALEPVQAPSPRPEPQEAAQHAQAPASVPVPAPAPLTFAQRMAEARKLSR